MARKPLAWVETENARSLAVLKGDPRYATFHDDALKIVNATDRIPQPDLIGTTVYNFWQDPDQRARALAADDAGELRHRRAGLGDGARPRQAVGRREGQLGLARRQLSAAGLSPLPDRRSPTAARTPTRCASST